MLMTFDAVSILTIAHGPDNKWFTNLYAGDPRWIDGLHYRRSVKRFVAIQINGVDVTLDKKGLVYGERWGGTIRIKLHTGADNQLADPDLIREIPWWTFRHRARGIAYYAVTLTYNKAIYPTADDKPHFSATVEVCS